MAIAAFSLSSQNPVLSLLSHCNSIRHLQQIHSLLIHAGLTHSAAAQSHVLSFCCSKSTQNPDFLHYARHLFDEIPHPDPHLYNTLITSYSTLNSPHNALSLYLTMLTTDSPPNDHTFPCLLKSFDRNAAVKFGNEIHAHAVKFGFGDNPYVQSSLICMYVLAGDTGTAREVFERSDRSNVVMWNAMISGYNKCKQFEESCRLFKRMQGENVRPTLVTFTSVLSACAKLKDLEFGRWVHGVIGDSRMVTSVKLKNALVEMYGGCGDMAAAWMIFEGMEERKVVTWTSLFSGFANTGHVDRAMKVFDRMPKRDRVKDCDD